MEILSYKNEYFYGDIILFSGVPDKIVSSLTKNMEGLYKLITIEGNSGGTNFVQEQYRTINVGGIIRGTKHRVVNCVVPDFNNTVEETTNNEKNNYRQNL